MMTLVLELNAVVPHTDLDHANTVRALFHDLRQPLKAILLFADSRGGDPAHRLDAIGVQARWMAALVEEVLGSRAQRSMQRVDVSALALSAVERARDAARCELSFSGEPGLYALVDEVGLGRAIACVADNAIRAAGPDGHVLVTVSRHDRGVAVSVWDDGPGPGRIKPQTSLGLTITRAIVCSHGGTFELVERTTGGTCALITLPSAAIPDRHSMRISAP